MKFLKSIVTLYRSLSILHFACIILIFALLFPQIKDISFIKTLLFFIGIELVFSGLEKILDKSPAE